jgi:hypothetical protein
LLEAQPQDAQRISDVTEQSRILEGPQMLGIEAEKKRFSVTVTKLHCKLQPLQKELFMNRKQANHHANQHNPNNIAHKQVNDNRSNQGNPTSPVYHQGRAVPKQGVKGK